MNIADYSAAEHLAPEDAQAGVPNGAGSPKRPPAAPGIAALAARSSRRNATALSSINGARSSWRHYYPLTLCLAVFVSSATLVSRASADPALSASGTNARLAASAGRAAVSSQAKVAAPSTDRAGRATVPAFPVSAAVQLSSGKPATPAKPVLAKTAPGDTPDQVAATPDRITTPEAAARPSAHIINVSGQVTRPNESGVAKVRVAQAPQPSENTNPAPAAAAATNLPPVPPAAIENLGAGKKVIKVSGLQLPPLSKPLPMWMQAAAVRVEKLDRPALPAPANGKRLAQNPDAPPVRQPAQPVTNSDRLPNQIQVAVSTFVVLLTTTDLQTVAVADPTIADVAVVNARAVLVNGKAPGVTSLVIVDKQKIRQYTVRVTSAPGTQPVDVATAIGLPGVSVRPLRDALVLEGEVASADEARRAVEIAGIYSPKVINQLTIRGSQSAESGLAAQVQDLLSGFPGVTVKIAGTSVILTGTVDTPKQIVDAETIARAAGKDLTVVNLLHLPPLTVDQVRQTFGAAAEPVTQGPVVPGSLTTQSPFIIREAGGSIILEGTVDSQATLDQALATAGRTGLPVINRVLVRAAATAEDQMLTGIAAAIGIPGVRVSGTTKRLVLTGTVADTTAAVTAEQIARGFATEVDNLLQTANPILVDVDISIAEISNTGLKSLGFQFPSLQDSSTTGYVIGQRSFNADSPGPLVNSGQTTVNTPILDRALGTQSAFQAALRAEVTKGNVRLLSNPHTTVLSGRTATFQVGGQVPVPVSITQSATGTITGIAFKDFGVLVDVVPNAAPGGAVTLRLRTEVSQPDASIGFTPFAGSSIIPGFTRRATVSEVTIQPNGTLALGGLISKETRKTVSKLPVLGDLPILGSLFTSRRFQDDQTELVIFVTPKVLPNPLPEGTVAAAGVVAVGNTTNRATVLGNPGITSFQVGPAGGAAGGGGGQ